MKITICGAGNAAHTLVPLVAGSDEHQVTIFSSLPGEARRWQGLLAGGRTVELTLPDGTKLAGRPGLITDDAEAAASGCDLLLLALPAFAHEAILQSVAPFLPRSAWLVALPARGGFHWLVRQVLPAHQGPIVGLQTLPWACRIQVWGRRVEVLGIKALVDLAAWPLAETMQAVETLTEFLRVPMTSAGSFLALTLANTGQIIHPGIMYGLFHGWDGQPFAAERVPLFYGGVDAGTAQVLQALSDEIQHVRASVERSLPGVDLDSVLPLADWLRRSYPDQVADARTLESSFTTNRAYAGLTAPVRPVAGPGQGQFEPWFASRYLAEDVPFGLLVTRGIAEIAGVPTPAADQVIAWTQNRLGKEYLVDGHVAGRDVAESRAPQRFSLQQLQELVN